MADLVHSYGTTILRRSKIYLLPIVANGFQEDQRFLIVYGPTHQTGRTGGVTTELMVRFRSRTHVDTPVHWRLKLVLGLERRTQAPDPKCANDMRRWRHVWRIKKRQVIILRFDVCGCEFVVVEDGARLHHVV